MENSDICKFGLIRWISAKMAIVLGESSNSTIHSVLQMNECKKFIRPRLIYTFLYSSGHSEAKKIPQKSRCPRHFAYFFQKTKFFSKIFFWLKIIGKVQNGFLAKKIFFGKKFFFWKTLRKISQIFFLTNTKKNFF